MRLSRSPTSKRVTPASTGAAPRRAAWLCLLIGLSPALPASAQAPETSELMGRIVAQLVDAESGAPIEGAFVALTTLDRRALSDTIGTVAFFDLPPGSYQLQIRHIAYGTQTVQIDVQGVQSAVAAIPLSQTAVQVGELEVLIEHRPRFLEEKGFYERQVEGLGTYFDPQFVERWNMGGWTTGNQFVQLLLDLSPAMPVTGCVTGTPQVIIDGQPSMDDDGHLNGRPSTALDMLATYSIGAVEVYSNSHGIPYEALRTSTGCGSIVIWTNRWRGRTRELGGGDIELCQPKDPAHRVVEGTIRDEFTGVLLPGAHVFALRYPAGKTLDPETIEIISDRNARYRVCDIPRDHVLTLQVEAADRKSAELEIPLDAQFVTRDLTVRVAGPGDIAGRVLDRSTGRPVAAADILVTDDGSRTQTDSDGYFALEDVMPGDHLVQISHLGFAPMQEMVSIVADRTVDVRVQLSADPIALEPLVVTAIRDRRLEIRGFYDRRIQGERTGLGTFLGAEEIARRVAAQTSSLLREIPGLMVTCSGRDCVVGAARSDCERTNVYINGTLAVGERRSNIRANRQNSASIDELVLPSEIMGVEAYPGGASLPAEFSGTTGRCGAVAIWTR